MANRYLFAAATVLISFLLTLLVERMAPGSHLYSINLVSTFVAALYGGVGPGVLTAFAEALLVDYQFVEPLNVVLDSYASVLGVVIYAAFALIVASLVEKLKEVFGDQLSARKEAEEAVLLRERVLAMVSHDLRNPLSAIGLSARILEQRILDDKMRRHAEIISRSARQMQRLIDDLLDATRIEKGTFAVHPEESNVPSVIAEAVETMTPQAAEKGVSIEVEVREPIPLVALDRQRMIQVICNLLGNSIKFSPGGSTIGISAAAAGREVRITVSDQGPGIPPERRTSVFGGTWQRPDSAHLGTGLGLFISRAIVEAHGGRIGVQESTGPGTTMVFSLPVRPQSAKSTAA